MRVLGCIGGWESHPPPPPLCVQEDLTLPPPYPHPLRLRPVASLCVRLGACDLANFFWGWVCGLAQYVRARMLASLRSIYLRPRSRWVRCPG